MGLIAIKCSLDQGITELWLKDSLFAITSYSLDQTFSKSGV